VKGPALVAPNEGLADQLDYILSADISGVLPWVLVLWTNADLFPVATTVWSDVTEASFTGYSRVTIARDGWTDAVLQYDQAVSTYGTTPTTWIASGAPQTLYGYAIITQTATVIRYIQRFPVPLVAAPGLPVGVLPRVTLGTQSGCGC
jgi:hypothetical protein